MIKKRIQYKVGKKVEEPAYNKNIDVVCGEGIHFFINKEIALLYGLDKVENGDIKVWHDNGQLMDQYFYVDGKLHGEHKEWYENGKLRVQTNYIEDKRHGEYKLWHGNDQLWIHTHYIEGKKHGDYKEWYFNGQLKVQTHQQRSK